MATTYTVHLSNSFDAESPVDAVSQMVTYALDNAGQAGYRVEWEGACILLDAPGESPDDCSTHDHETESVFIDAEDLDTGGL